MAQGTTVTADSLGRLLSQVVINLGGAAPTSDGLGELVAAIANAIPGFTPPSSSILVAPTGATAESYPRGQTNSAALTLASGTLNMSAISLPANTVVNNLNFLTGTTAAVTPTHSWAGLYNSSRVLLAISADGLTTPIPASTPEVFPIATVAAGAAASFTTTYTGLYYVGIVVVAGTQPTYAGLTGSATANGQPPITAGTSTTGLSTPSTFPTTAGAITPTAGEFYTYAT